MRTEVPKRPAALALLVYATGLAVAPELVSARAAIVGLSLMALLTLALRTSAARRVSAFMVFGVAGLVVGAVVMQRDVRDAARLAANPPDTFTTIDLPIEDGWAPRPDGSWGLSARRFKVQTVDGSLHLIRKRMHLLLYDAPPWIRESRTIVARGFLRRLEGGAYVLSVKSSKLIRPEGYASWLDPACWNRRLAARLTRAAKGSERAIAGSALTQALVLGRGDLLPRETIELYQRGGTYHLLVFSGVQIAMLAAIVRWVLLRMKFRRSADVALVLICAFMPRFVGSDPSVSRSSLMIGLLLGSWLWKRPADASNLVFVSALVRLILVPEDLVSPGFALTYGATAGILVIGRALARGHGPIGRALAYGAGAEIGTTPFTLFFFRRATPGGSLVTLIVSPLLLLMLGLGFFATIFAGISPAVCRAALEIVGLLNEPVLWINALVADEARLSIVAAAPTTIAVVASAWIAVAGASSARKRGVVLAVLALLVPVGSSVVRSRSGWVGSDVQILDVGQGDSILVRSGSRAMLVDGGGSRTNPSFGVRVLLPLLVDQGVRHFDAVLLSHPHPDHCTGLVAVLRDLEVDRLVISRRHLATDCGRALTDVALVRHVAVQDAESIRPFLLGAIGVEVWTSSFRYNRSWENNSSVVTRLTSGSRKLLLMGDVERDAERVLVETRGPDLSAAVIKVAHHGSRSSTTAPFLDAVKPKVALISCGNRNRFGHPHEATLERLFARGVRTISTARAGSIHVTFDGGPLLIERQFDSSPRPP